MSRLAARLKAETADVHREAERSRFMAGLLRGQVDRTSYCAYLSSLHAVYGALEPALTRHRLHPLIQPVFDPDLARVDALAADLRFLQGDSWIDEVPPRPAARRYAERLEELAQARPELLLAHAYVRYLGDLSGGQVLRRIIARAYGLPDGEGTRFYEFGDDAATRELTSAFRAGLAALEPDARQSDAIVAEALRAFEMHQCLFEELAQLGASAGGSRVEPQAI